MKSNVSVMDVNEKIVEEWVRRCKRQFTIINIHFKVTGPKGGSNYSDIDILGLDAKGNVYDYEIKWRSTPWVGTTQKETLEALAGQLLRKERTREIQNITGKKPDHRILITPKLMLEASRKRYEKLLAEFKKESIEIIFFETVLDELILSVNSKGRYDSEILQLIRMFRILDISPNRNKSN